MFGRRLLDRLCDLLLHRESTAGDVPAKLQPRLLDHRLFAHRHRAERDHHSAVQRERGPVDGRSVVDPIPDGLASVQIGLVDWVCAPGQALDACIDSFLEPYLARTRAVLEGFKAPVAAARQRAHAELAAIEEDRFVKSWTSDEHWAAVAAALKK